MSKIITIIGDRRIPSKKNNMKIGRRRVYKDPAVSEFEEYLKALATEEMLDSQTEMIEGPVKLTLSVTYPDKRRRDLQNCFAAVCDALNDIVYKDDSQIVEISATKQVIKGEDGFVIYVEELPKKEN